MSLNLELERYQADQEMVDSIKIDASTIDPSTDLKVQGAVTYVVDRILDRYSSHIPDYKQERALSMNQRVVVTDLETLQTFRNEYHELERTAVRVRGFNSMIGDIVVVQDFNGCENEWDNISPEAKDREIKSYGSEQEARKIFGVDLFGTTIIHEVLHSFHDKGILNKGFTEHGVCYYTREIGRELGRVMESDVDKLQANLYRLFVRDYGDAVHSVFFGSDFPPEELSFWNSQYNGHCINRMKLARYIGEDAFTEE